MELKIYIILKRCAGVTANTPEYIHHRLIQNLDKMWKKGDSTALLSGSRLYLIILIPTLYHLYHLQKLPRSLQNLQFIPKLRMFVPLPGRRVFCCKGLVKFRSGINLKLTQTELSNAEGWSNLIFWLISSSWVRSQAISSSICLSFVFNSVIWSRVIERVVASWFRLKHG